MNQNDIKPMLTADRLLGRQLTFATHEYSRGYMVATNRSLTVVGYDPAKGFAVRAEDGSRQWFTVDGLSALFASGALNGI